MDDFEKNLCEALIRCDEDLELKPFSLLYPFTTENISGYISKFDLANRSLLTVGSSSDQILNAVLMGCKDITLIDICSYTKYYFYLKKCAILSLSYDEFLEFLCYTGYPTTFKKNLNCLNKNTFDRIKPLLRLMDYESYLFWDELLVQNDNITIRKKLFSCDEYKKTTIQKINPYLKDEKNYNKLKSLILNIKPNFINDDIMNIEMVNKFDNIFLSNLCGYYGVNEIKTLLDKLNNNLNYKGSILYAYLYQTTISSKYQPNWNPIYNLDITLSILKEYLTLFKSFDGVEGFNYNSPDNKDSVLIYRKGVL